LKTLIESGNKNGKLTIAIEDEDYELAGFLKVQIDKLP